MEPFEVYFTDLHATPSLNLLKKLERLVRAAGFEKIDFNRKMTAIKIHFGEPGNLAYLRPNFAARIVSMVREKGGKPYLTDCNTLYHGSVQMLRTILKLHTKTVIIHSVRDAMSSSVTASRALTIVR